MATSTPAAVLPGLPTGRAPARCKEDWGTFSLRQEPDGLDPWLWLAMHDHGLRSDAVCWLQLEQQQQQQQQPWPSSIRGLEGRNGPEGVRLEKQTQHQEGKSTDRLETNKEQLQHRYNIHCSVRVAADVSCSSEGASKVEQGMALGEGVEGQSDGSMEQHSGITSGPSYPHHCTEGEDGRQQQITPQQQGLQQQQEATQSNSSSSMVPPVLKEPRAATGAAAAAAGQGASSKRAMAPCEEKQPQETSARQDRFDPGYAPVQKASLAGLERSRSLRCVKFMQQSQTMVDNHNGTAGPCRMELEAF